MALDAPPVDLAVRALIDVWPKGTPICRAHPHTFGSAELDGRPNADFRFSTIHHAGHVIPVAYGGEDDHAAASETIFHTIDSAGGAVRPRRVYVDKYLTWQWSTVHPVRDLFLVRLDDVGLAVLGTSRADFIETGRRSYSTTRTWAEAIAVALTVDGLWWYWRQDPVRKAILLFGQVLGRPPGIGPGDLASNQPALPFALPQGLDRLDQIADDLDIEVTRP